MRRGMIRSHKTCPLDQGGCGRTLCKKCLAYACMTEQEAAAKGLKGRVSTFCKSCFQSLSILDFGKTEECLGPAAGDAPAILYVHGAGGCRTMVRGVPLHLRRTSIRFIEAGGSLAVFWSRLCNVCARISVISRCHTRVVHSKKALSSASFVETKTALQMCSHGSSFAWRENGRENHAIRGNREHRQHLKSTCSTLQCAYATLQGS
jgi:hypothetical protein